MFTGRQLDEETGLYFYRARYYDPVKGRFLQRDPLGYVDGMNLYEYARSNPVRWTDPLGLWCGECEPGIPNEFHNKVAGMAATSVGRKPGAFESNLSILDDISLLSALSSATNIGASAFKGLTTVSEGVSAAQRAATYVTGSVTKKYSTQGMPSGSDFKGPLGEINEVLKGEYGHGYWLYLLIEYDSCEKCCAWKNPFNWGRRQKYEFVKHHKYVQVTEGSRPAGLENFQAGTYGGTDDTFFGPSGSDLANAIQRATRPGASGIPKD
jgi:RHS repeat-associated protein